MAILSEDKDLCSFPRCECLCHPKDCVFKPENRKSLTNRQKNDIIPNREE